jgi:hypothetical protein
MTAPRQCPRCGLKSRRLNCCGIDLGFRRRWRMTPAMVRQVHVIARVRKGLDTDTYRLHLAAVGVTTSKRLNRTQHYALLQRFAALPDVPRWRTRGELRGQRA